jgi:hypothetical protein
MLGGFGEDDAVLSTAYLVDLATGVCTPQPTLDLRDWFAAARLPDGRIVCVGGVDVTTVLWSVEVFEPPAQGALVFEPLAQGVLDTAWTWREVPAMSVARQGCSGCVLSDGRFAVLGGENDYYEPKHVGLRGVASL